MATLAWFGVGLALLAGGGEMLVRGAAGIARALGLTPLVIGLTVMAFGTSAPELVVTTVAALDGRPDIAVGNVVGSNICNVLLVLGVCALLGPLVVASDLVRRDVPIMIAASLLCWFFASDGGIGAAEAAVLCGGFIAVTALTVYQGRRAAGAGATAAPVNPGRLGRDVGLAAAGVTMLVGGARAVVLAAVAAAQALGVSEAVIGLTVVAVGTSLPELAASVMAAVRGQRDMAVGNVVGSNLFNILGILGVSGLVAGGLPVAASIEAFDLPVMVAVAIACLPLFARAHLLARWEGGLFLGYYVAYLLYLGLTASAHEALPRFSAVMLKFVLPLTAITLVLVSVRALRGGAPAPDR